MITAKEAEQLSAANSTRIEKEKAVAAAKAKTARILKEKKDQRNFYNEFSKLVDASIKWSVEHGEKYAEIGVGESQGNPVDAQRLFDGHKHLGEIKRVMARLRKAGYIVAQGTRSIRCTTQHESSVPDYDYWLHHAYLSVSW
jgi:hypothetical protein